MDRRELTLTIDQPPNPRFPTRVRGGWLLLSVFDRTSSARITLYESGSREIALAQNTEHENTE